MKQCNPIRKQQGGYILITVVILLSVLMLLSLQVMNQSVTSNKISGYNRDAAESLLLAENAVNWLYGYYANGADLDMNGQPDSEAKIDKDNPNPLPLPYMYFVSRGNGIDQTSPDILQKVANGEARDGKEGNPNQSQVSYDEVFLKIKNLSQGSSKPVILVQNSHGIQRSHVPWENLDANYKAAVWLEIVQHANNENKFILVAQAAAQSGKSKSYVQRYIGTFSDTLGQFSLAGISQANP